MQRSNFRTTKRMDTLLHHQRKVHFCTSTFIQKFEFLDCNCNEQGSKDGQCNADDNCNCKDNITGDNCDTCVTEFYGFPHCKGKLKINLGRNRVHFLSRMWLQQKWFLLF